MNSHSNMPAPTIDCPQCGAELRLDTKLLLAGKLIECPACQTKIGLQETATDLARDALSKMESVRSNIEQLRAGAKRA